MTDEPAVIIARNWYKNVGLVHNGVDFGKCICYDVLQIINRSILREQEKRKSHVGDTNERTAET